MPCQNTRCLIHKNKDKVPSKTFNEVFNSTVTNRHYKIINLTPTPLTCSSNNIIYLISCKRCGIQYVGETRDNEVKHYQYDADYIIWSAQKSITDLQCEYLDLFLLHRPSPLMNRDEIQKAVAHLMEQ